MWVVHWNILALSTRTATNLRPSHSLPAFWHSPRWPIHPIPSMDKNDLVGMLFQPSPKLWGHQLAKKWGHPLCQKPVASFGIFRIFQGRIFPQGKWGDNHPHSHSRHPTSACKMALLLGPSPTWCRARLSLLGMDQDFVLRLDG